MCPHASQPQKIACTHIYFVYNDPMNKDTFIKVRVTRAQRACYAMAAESLDTNVSKEIIRCLDRMVKRADKKGAE